MMIIIVVTAVVLCNNPRVDQIIIIRVFGLQRKKVTSLHKKDGNLILLPNCNSLGGSKDRVGAFRAES